MGVGHYIVVEQQEYELYADGLAPTATLLVLDPAYKRSYDVCDDFGLSKSTGPGPARNFAWDHAASMGYAYHWVMDDNIDGFYRLNRNLKVPCYAPGFWRAQEAFLERHDNVSMGGPNYFMFASRKAKMPPIVCNTRIYSCNLIRNDAPFRWRGRYNEDTDLSIRMMRAGLATAQFNQFLQMKTTTQVLGGGNTAEFYAHEGTKAKSEMQVALHPDISRLVWKFGRWHHEVDYSVFRRNPLRTTPALDEREGTNEFGMAFERQIDGVWTRETL
jgi:hypothetical protein